MQNKPQRLIHPQTKEPLKPEDLYPLFAEELARQEFNETDRWIEIPEEVRDKYKIYRPSPLVRAYGLEKALDTPAHIYFKNESVSPVGSHKLNSALPQVYYNKIDGTTNSPPRPVPDNGELPWHSPGRPSGGDCGIHGQDQLRTETLPAFADADLGCAGDCLA